MKYQIEDFIVNDKVKNPSLKVNGSLVELLPTINPLYWNTDILDVPYWRVYMRPEDKHIADSNLDDAMTLHELIDYLLHCRKPHYLNAFPRKTKLERSSYYCKVLEDFVEIWKKNTEQICLRFTKSGKLVYTDRTIKVPYSHKRKYFYKNHSKEWKLQPYYGGDVHV